MPSRTLLLNGLIIDGSGRPATPGHVLIEGEKIIKLGDFDPPTLAQSIDCQGAVIAPGFIDVHTHDDAIVLKNPAMLPKISQGITTVVTGNCGISLAPHVTTSPLAPLGLLGSEHFRFARLADYARAVDAAQPALNVSSLIGHTSLRASVMREFDRPANAEERAAMAELLRQAMADGALGLSSGVFYAPAFAADEQELLELASIAAQSGGIYTTHIRNEMDTLIEAIEEAARTARRAGLPLVLSHHKCAKRALWGATHESLTLIDRLSTRQPIGLDVYPYTAGSTILREDLVDGVIDVLVTQSEPFPQMAGRLLADIAQEWGCTQQEACLRLQPGGACYFQMDEDDMRRVLLHPRTMIGSDGLPHDVHPHPRLWGTFPRVLGHYCRDLGLLRLESAVAKMTSLSAAQFGLHKRGQLQCGFFADIVVFDPRTVKDCASFANPHQTSEGILHVFVNGQRAYAAKEGVSTQRSGRFVRRG